MLHFVKYDQDGVAQKLNLMLLGILNTQQHLNDHTIVFESQSTTYLNLPFSHDAGPESYYMWV